MTNRGWNILTIAIIFILAGCLNVKLNNFEEKLDKIQKEVDHVQCAHSYGSLAYQIRKMQCKHTFGSLAYVLDHNESAVKRLESNMKQVVESCGKYWQYY